MFIKHRINIIYIYIRFLRANHTGNMYNFILFLIQVDDSWRRIQRWFCWRPSKRVGLNCISEKKWCRCQIWHFAINYSSTFITYLYQTGLHSAGDIDKMTMSVKMEPLSRVLCALLTCDPVLTSSGSMSSYHSLGQPPTYHTHFTPIECYANPFYISPVYYNFVTKMYWECVLRKHVHFVRFTRWKNINCIGNDCWESIFIVYGLRNKIT